MTPYRMHGIDHLRKASQFFGHFSESFAQRWSVDQLMCIYRFAMSEDGRHIEEDPTKWPRETLIFALMGAT